MAYTPEQHPIVLQIGGSNLDNLAKATELANAYGYDEINFKLVEFFSPILTFPFIFALLDELIQPFPSLKFTSCGCPSPKVAGHGCFGVRLMLDPKV